MTINRVRLNGDSILNDKMKTKPIKRVSFIILNLISFLISYYS